MSPKLNLTIQMLNSGQDYYGREHDRDYLKRELAPRAASLWEIYAKAPHLLTDNQVIGSVLRDALDIAMAIDAPVRY